MPVRFAREADVPAMLAIYAPYVENTTVTFEYEVPSLSAFTARFRETVRQFPWLVWEEAGQVLGYAYGSAPFQRAAYQWCAEASVYLCPQARGQGIGRALYAGLEDILRRQGYQLLYALITSENAPSLAFHQALGYTFLADLPGCGFKLGRWLGVIWLQKRLNPVEFPSSAPPAWQSVVQNSESFR